MQPAHGSARVAAAAEPGAMLALTRAGIVALLVLGIANGGFLYFFPARAEPDYAWAIAPPASAALLGAGYLAGALVAAGLGVFAARRFSSVADSCPPSAPSGSSCWRRR